MAGKEMARKAFGQGGDGSAEKVKGMVAGWGSSVVTARKQKDNITIHLELRS